MGLGLLGTAMAGFAQGAGAGIAKGAEQYGEYLSRKALVDAQAEIITLRDQRMSELEEGRTVRAEERKKAPYSEAQAATERWRTENTTYDEASGTAVKQEPDEASMNKRLREELLGRGESTAAHQLAIEANAREKLDFERAAGARKERQDERQHEESMNVRQQQLLVQQRQLARLYDLDKPQSTALTRNVEFMIESGIAKTPKEAFDALHTKAERSPTQFIEQTALNLLKSGEYRYRGKDGRQNAVSDARELLGKIREVDQSEFEAGYDKVQPLGAKKRRSLDVFFGDE